MGLLMRQMLSGEMEIDPRAALGLFVSDRWWHVRHVVQPALAEGKVVICDRYAYSTWVYQQDMWSPRLLREIMADLPAPHKVFILDCPVEEAQRRKTPEKELFDAAEAQQRYAARYQNLLGYNTFRLGHEKIAIIDSLKNDLETVTQVILNAVLEGRK